MRSDSEFLFIEAELPATAPVLAAMAQSGKASLTDEERTTEMNAINEDERRAISDFLAACRPA